MGDTRYLLGKVGQLFLTLLLILTLAFFLFRVWQPGDPVLTYARRAVRDIHPNSSTRSAMPGGSISPCRSSTSAT